MPISGATPSQNPNIRAISTDRRQLIGSAPKASAVRKLSRLRVKPRMSRLPIIWSVRVNRSLAGDPGGPGSPAKCESLRQGEGDQRAPLAGAEHAGQEPLRPRAPARRHGDVLPAVDAVSARARVVAAAAL